MSALGLDHVGIAVHDLDAAAEQFRRLGFQLTPRGYHTLPPSKPGAARPRVGTGNNCVMLGRGYIELIGVVDPAYEGRLRDDLARYEGLHIVAFGTDDAAAATASLRQAGIPAEDARLLERPIEENGREDLARFEIIDFANALPGLYAFAIHHATPELLWRPALLQHPNGAKILEGITVAVADAHAFERQLGRIVGNDRAEEGAGTVKLSVGAVRIVDGDWLAAHGFGKAMELPVVASMTLGTGDLGRTASLLSANGVGFERVGGRIVVPPAEGCGAMIEFIAG